VSEMSLDPGTAGLPPFATRRLAGWGNFPAEECDVYRPDFVDELAEIVTRAPQLGLIARGLGRSYGDAALNRGGAVVSSERLDRMLGFDPETGVLTCEAAVSLAEIIDHLLPRGFFLPVTPGTKHITVAGAIAADVHGKNHHRSGSTADFLLDFHLLTSTGEILRCSRDENAEVFWATVGGMGLTGVILEARLRLARVENAYLAVDYERAPNLDAVLERFLESDDDYAYTVAWIDCLARGPALGRSVLMRANPAPMELLPRRARRAPLAMPRHPRPGVPFDLPGFVLNPWSMRLFNAGIYRVHRDGPAITDYDTYSYVLDSVGHWNRIYGRRGVLQYQCLLPPEESREGLIEILEALSSQRRPSFLAVLKRFGAASGGLLSFPRPGTTLALDLPNTGGDLLRALDQLDEVVLRRGGSVYLAKDARLGAENFAAMYPQLGRFREVKAKVDPERRFVSSQARRLGIVDAA
jgi:decaprenylphospho-beta-D-ribofuranose 2-oxidase